MVSHGVAAIPCQKNPAGKAGSVTLSSRAQGGEAQGLEARTVMVSIEKSGASDADEDGSNDLPYMDRVTDELLPECISKASSEDMEVRQDFVIGDTSITSTGKDTVSCGEFCRSRQKYTNILR
jgi:hypothetical protein